MRLALVHAERVRITPGAPAVADPGESEPTERTDCLLALAGVEPADAPDGAGAERVRETAAELRCDAVVVVLCPPLVSAVADRTRAGDLLCALADALPALDTAVAAPDYYPELDLETKGHPHAVRVFRPGDATEEEAFDPTPLDAAGLAEPREDGLAWTPAGTVARRALVAGVAERFALAGAEPRDPPCLPSRDSDMPDVSDDSATSTLSRPLAASGTDPSGPVYATAPGEDGVVRPEAFDPTGSLRPWLELVAESLRALGFNPEISARATPADESSVRDALDSSVATGDATRVEFRTAGATGVVERTERGTRCVPVGTIRGALAALALDLPVSLAPTQFRFVPIDGTEDRCRSLASSLAARADVDDRSVPTGERLADAESVPFVAVVGPGDDALRVAGSDGEERVSTGDLDTHVREPVPDAEWPPVRARRPLLLSARRR